MAIRMGFEGVLLIGAAATKADTAVLDAKDITFTIDVERGDTTVRGASSFIPFKTELVTLRAFTVEWGMLFDDSGGNSAVMTEILVAVHAGTALAVYLVPVTGDTGPDFDATISASWGMPLNGEQLVTFTAVPSLVRFIDGS